jgi:hypothetical protein
MDQFEQREAQFSGRGPEMHALWNIRTSQNHVHSPHSVPQWAVVEISNICFNGSRHAENAQGQG